MENKLQKLQQVVDSRNRIKNKLIQLKLVDNTAKLSDCADALETIDSLGGGGGDTLKTLLDTTKSAYGLFHSYKTGTSVDELISYNSTENVTNMKDMFYNCFKLLSIPSLNTRNVTNMSRLAFQCSALKQVPVFDTPKVTDVSYMFKACGVLTEVSMLDMSNVTTTDSMFSNCYKLKKVKLSKVSNKITASPYWFSNCESLELIDFRGATSVPTLTNTYAFSSVPSTCKVVVPDALFYSWKNGTNWSSLSVTWVKESEYVEE